MKKERQIEELAKLDGRVKLDPWSHDALQPIIDGMNYLLVAVYRNELCKVCETDPDGEDEELILQATPEQKAEAILKAYGKWETE